MDVIAKSYDITYEVLREEKQRSRSTGIEVDPTDNMVSSIIYLDVAQEKIRELDAKLTDRLFDELGDPHLSHFWIGLEQEVAEQEDGD
jgi:hypothetical protein